MNTLSKPKEVSPCCSARVKVNMRDGGYFCNACLKPCTIKQEPKLRKVTGEADEFRKVWGRCGGKSEVSGKKLLPPDNPMWHAQFSHLLPKGSYQEDRLKLENIVACTVEEHTEEWPFVKELDDQELRAIDMGHWIPVVTRFRAMRLAYNRRLNAELSGKA